MSKISLRAYNREIETLIERGHTEEAIAHCKYILKSYPKHLNTYRLLGKAFLETQRYSEAADILTRILSVIPDDFVAQIGMSIIREDEGNLDAAIFHMERSFEIQPSNAAIQDELRRLYGRRDGIEPPKLRLTRGALVRMYARGELYRQAIAEARAAIKEDPQRLDLEIVLARMYYQTNQKAEAAEICSRLVMKLPYCLEANRILADVLPDTSRSEDAKIYQQRLEALEPYLAYQSDLSQDVSQTPDNAVTLDRLEWVPSLESSQQPAWASNLGLKIEEKEEEQTPDWLSGLAQEEVDASDEVVAPLTPTLEEEPAQPLITDNEPIPGLAEIDQEQPGSEDEIPDWMRALGEESVGQEEEKLPDWMRESTDAPSSSLQDQQFGQTLSLDEASLSTDEDQVPDWMKSAGWERSEHPAEDQQASLETNETMETDAFPADEIPEWLKDLAPSSQEDHIVEEPSKTEETSTIQGRLEPAAEANLEEDLPDWMQSPETGLDENANLQSQEPLPEWLTEISMDEEDSVPSTETIEGAPDLEQFVADTQPTVPQMEGEIHEIPQEAADHVNLEEVATEPSLDTENLDDAMAWLESLAAKQGADEETLLTKPDERVETPPDWVKDEATAVDTSQIEQPEEITPQAVEQGEEKEAIVPESVESQVEDAIASEPVEPQAEGEISPSQAVSEPEEISPQDSLQDQASVDEVPTAVEPSELQESVSEVAPTPSDETEQEDMDSAFAWLESLAAKQGAEPDSLIVSSEDRLENPPDWVKQESAEIEAEEEVEVEQKVDEAPEETVEEMSEGLPDWLTSTEQAETPGISVPVDEALPDWLKEDDLLQETGEEQSTPVAEEVTATTAEEQPPDWVQESEAAETISEEPETQLNAESAVEDVTETPEITATEEQSETEPLPDWLSGELSSTAPAVEEASDQETEPQTLPDWLQAETPLNEVEPGEGSLSIEEGETPPLPDWLKDLESEQETESSPVESGMYTPPAEVLEIGETSQVPDEMILQAQAALGQDQIDKALSIYQRLVDQDQKLDETIHDLRDALYRFPVDSAIWQTLGDAYMHTNQVQEALDAFTKAEELLK